MYRIKSHVKFSIAWTLFDGLEEQAFEDELKHLVRDECKRAPELKFRCITLKHSLCHIDCIKSDILVVNASTLYTVQGKPTKKFQSRISQPSSTVTILTSTSRRDFIKCL